jgi:hemoglobin-like flavoprotein
LDNIRALSDSEISLIRESFSELEDNLTDIIADLYPTFLAQYPDHAQYFEETDFKRQREGVEEFFRTAIPNLDQPDTLADTLEHLAQIHRDRGVPPEAYDEMGTVFLSILSDYAGESWNDDLREAWMTLWTGLSDILRQ